MSFGPFTASSSFTSSGETMYDLDSSLFHGSTRHIATYFLRSIKSQRQFDKQGMFDKWRELRLLLTHYYLHRSVVGEKARCSS